jgi:putative radical SAM enzyme (TIGR03279 family)
VLSGSFVTLTNLTEDDWTRLEEQRLGPMRVSVHATDLSTRRRLLGNPAAPDVIGQIRRLEKLHIGVHCQIVLVPDQNDGECLSRTVTELAQLAPTVESIAIVPVGRTRFSSAFTTRNFDERVCLDLIKQVEKWQKAFRKEYGVGLVYLGDEFYMKAGETVPSTRSYDGFPQYENGVGMVRCLLDDWTRLKKRLRLTTEAGSRQVTIACGTSIAPVLIGIMQELAAMDGPRVEVVPIINRFFGESVTTSGLLTAGDVLKGLNARGIGDMVMLPRTMLDSEGKITIDGEPPTVFEQKLVVPVGFAGLVSEMLLLADCIKS